MSDFGNDNVTGESVHEIVILSDSCSEDEEKTTSGYTSRSSKDSPMGSKASQSSSSNAETSKGDALNEVIELIDWVNARCETEANVEENSSQKTTPVKKKFTNGFLFIENLQNQFEDTQKVIAEKDERIAEILGKYETLKVQLKGQQTDFEKLQKRNAKLEEERRQRKKEMMSLGHIWQRVVNLQQFFRKLVQTMEHELVDQMDPQSAHKRTELEAFKTEVEGLFRKVFHKLKKWDRNQRDMQGDLESVEVVLKKLHDIVIATQNSGSVINLTSATEHLQEVAVTVSSQTTTNQLLPLNSSLLVSQPSVVNLPPVANLPTSTDLGRFTNPETPASSSKNNQPSPVNQLNANNQPPLLSNSQSTRKNLTKRQAHSVHQPQLPPVSPSPSENEPPPTDQPALASKQSSSKKKKKPPPALLPLTAGSEPLTNVSETEQKSHTSTDLSAISNFDNAIQKLPGCSNTQPQGEIDSLMTSMSTLHTVSPTPPAATIVANESHQFSNSTSPYKFQKEPSPFKSFQPSIDPTTENPSSTVMNTSISNLQMPPPPVATRKRGRPAKSSLSSATMQDQKLSTSISPTSSWPMMSTFFRSNTNSYQPIPLGKSSTTTQPFKTPSNSTPHLKKTSASTSSSQQALPTSKHTLPPLHLPVLHPTALPQSIEVPIPAVHQKEAIEIFGGPTTSPTRSSNGPNVCGISGCGMRFNTLVQLKLHHTVVHSKGPTPGSNMSAAGQPVPLRPLGFLQPPRQTPVFRRNASSLERGPPMQQQFVMEPEQPSIKRPCLGKLNPSCSSLSANFSGPRTYAMPVPAEAPPQFTRPTVLTHNATITSEDNVLTSNENSVYPFI